MPQNESRRESTRQWLTGLVVIVATIVSFFGFARLSFAWTLGVSLTTLVGLLAFFWWTGQRKRRRRGQGEGC